MGRKDQVHEAWIRVVGLPFHLWIGEILKKVGDSYRGFVAMDKGIALRTNLLWVRILVKMNCNGKPSSINFLARARSYELQIWWEIQPRVADWSESCIHYSIIFMYFYSSTCMIHIHIH